MATLQELVKDIMYKKIKSGHGEMTVREKLERRGVLSLKDVELLQVIIGSGIKDYDYREIAKNVNAVINKHGADNVTIDDVIAVKGIGNAKAAVIFAALEFWRRQFTQQTRAIIDSPDEAAKQFDDLKDKRQEHVAMITLDGARRLINKHLVSVGTLTSSLVHPREVFSLAVEDRAASVIIAHNHPSGMLTVSDQDREVTQRIRSAGELMGIPLDDHLIITASGYVSA